MIKKISFKQIQNSNTDLLKANIFGVLPEALSADVECVFADQSMPVATYSAVKKEKRVEIINKSVSVLQNVSFHYLWKVIWLLPDAITGAGFLFIAGNR